MNKILKSFFFSTTLLASACAMTGGFSLAQAQEAPPIDAPPSVNAPRAAKPIPKNAPKPKPAAPQTQPAAATNAPTSPAPAQTGMDGKVDPSIYLATEHARQNGVTACMPMLTDILSKTIDGPHKAVSTWNNTAPNQKPFTTLALLKYNNEIAPRAVNFVMVAPQITPNNKCDGASLRVQPSKFSCEELATNLNKQLPAQIVEKIEKQDDIQTYPVFPNGQRVILLPTATSGCVVITNNLYFSQ